MRHARLQPDVDTQPWATSSLWSQTDGADHDALVDDVEVDVVVVGAGLAGLLTATLLTRAGATVRVLDRYAVGGVATRNTTAKVSALQGTQYQDIKSAAGGGAASAYATAQLDAVDGLRQLIDDLGIDCACTEAPAYTYAADVDGEPRARAELAAARAAGLDVEWVTDTELPYRIAGGVRLDGQLHVDPVRLCVGLAAALPAGTIADHTAVAGIDEQRDGCTVVTDAGARVRAGHVVLATQAPIVDPGLLVNRCTPKQSYCLAARTTGPVPEGMYLSCDERTRSLRPAVMRDGEPVLVLGGAGHHMGDPAATPERWDELISWATERFGSLEVTHRWATHDLVPTDHIPFIGRLAHGVNRRWVATGFAKWGMTNAHVAARILTAGIAGEAVDWADTFDATRIRRTLNREMVSIGTTATTHLLVDRITRRREPRCTHQGCVLRADTALGTWDCPCHGSRFAADGTVIQGPAKAPIDVT